jgi:hypothetical protein
MVPHVTTLISADTSGKLTYSLRKEMPIILKGTFLTSGFVVIII